MTCCAFVLFFSALILSGIIIIKGDDNVAETIFPPLPIAVTQTNNELCKRDSLKYIENLQNFTLWASELWDATAKSASGVLRGSIYQMGNFEQCLSVEAPFPTQYCLATIRAKIPEKYKPKDRISLYHRPNENVLQRLYDNKDVSQQARNIVKYGWCIPASCTVEDLNIFLNSYVKDLDLPFTKNNVSYSAEFSKLFCHIKEETNLNAANIAFCVLTLILILIVLIITCYDLIRNDNNYQKKNPIRKSLLYRMLMTFSAKLNYQELSKREDNNNSLSILYGMRTICILCIILDHRFGTFTSSALLNFDYVEKQYRSQVAPFLFHGDLFVDSFFLLSGLLVAYGLLNQFEKKKFNPGFIVLMRYVRLTPIYAYVIFYYATLFNYTGTGPLWKAIAGQDSQDCKDNWWTNLLYISNYVNADHMCMTHSWYLPCDFHYFIIGIGVCSLISRKKKYGIAVLLLLTIVSIIIPFILTVVFTRPALLHFYPEFLTGPKTHPDFLLTYSKSHTRATPYFMGMFGGLLYYNLKGKQFHVCRIKSYSILLLSVFMVVVAILGGSVFYNPYHKYNALESAAYAALHRPAFAIGSIGILYVASYGHARFIYAILSWWPWVPISKLTYGAYLVHMQFQLRSAAKFMNARQISYFDLIAMALSDMVLAFLTALVLYLTIEAPARKIFRMLLVPEKSIDRHNIELNKPETQQTDSRL